MNKQDAYELVEALRACGNEPVTWLKSRINNFDIDSNLSHRWMYDYFRYTLSVIEAGRKRND